LARSTAHLLETARTLGEKGVRLSILSMNVDTGTPTGRLMLTLLAGIAEFERDLMLERQREGIAKAKAEGRYKGRAPTARAKSAEVIALHRDGVAPKAIADRVGVSRASVFRILKDDREVRA
ncbi:MAG: recombinase family protein, partial [Pseudomonadota bacterium]